MRRPPIPYDAIGRRKHRRPLMAQPQFVAVNSVRDVKDFISAILAEPKKPTQIPPGDLSDAVGKHEEGEFDLDEADESNESSDDGDEGDFEVTTRSDS